MITYRLRGLLNLHLLATTVCAAAFFLLYALVYHYIPRVELSPDVNFALYFLCVVAGMLGSGKHLSQFATHFHRLSWADAARIATRQVVLVALMVFTLMVATKDRSISRIFLSTYLFFLWFILHFINHVLSRTLAGLAFHTAHRVPTLFLGRSGSVKNFGDWITQKRHLGYHPVGILSDVPSLPGAPAIAGLPWLGRIDQLGQVIEDKSVSQVILLELPSDQSVTARVVEKCQAAGCRLLIYTNMDEMLPVPMVPVMEEGRLFLALQEEPLEDPLNRMVKRMYDVVVALPVVLFILPPLSLLVWLMQRWQSPGPLFFSRPRGGQGRHAFMMTKFRSMRSSAPNPQLEAVQAKPGDERIYPFGRFLRKSSLDEFPQFWNVLLGRMSIVGPRPHLPQHDSEFEEVARAYRTRQLVKPGITGLAQVRGFRGEITEVSMLRQRVQLDIHYITHWSIWLDVQITLTTLGLVFFPPKSAV